MKYLIGLNCIIQINIRNIAYPSDSQYDFDKQQMKLFVLMDDNQYNRYMENFIYKKKKNGLFVFKSR